jgi:hypothetical protein
MQKKEKKQNVKTLSDPKNKAEEKQVLNKWNEDPGYEGIGQSSDKNDDEIDGSKPIGKAHGHLHDVDERNRGKFDRGLKQ